MVAILFADCTAARSCRSSRRAGPASACQQHGCILASPGFKSSRTWRLAEHLRLRSRCVITCLFPAMPISYSLPSYIFLPCEIVVYAGLIPVQLGMPACRAVLKKLSSRCSNVQESDLGAACQHALAFENTPELTVCVLDKASGSSAVTIA